MSKRSFHVIEDAWIPLRDGTRLAARIWMPEGAEQDPVPAILEHLPYRRRDGTAPRDESTYPVFAEAGYAGVRVDMRGSGDSEGVIEDEYSPQELADAVEVIEWLAAQDWCSGSVGMMGISWGGFNSLQVAALRPPALKAVISLSSTVDRYNDDIHFKNGCLLSANFYWATNMLCYSSRPPDPEIVGADWRTQWLKRLETIDYPLNTWLAHQRRDDYWRHGSICEDYDALEAAVLIIAGWGDGYRNAPPTAAAHLNAPVKAINGPWIHKYPHFAWPKPRLDFHAEAIRWWDHWLKGIENDAEDLPAYRAYVTEGVRPSTWRESDPGRWVAMESWPSSDVAGMTLHLTGDGCLSDAPGEGGMAVVASPQDCGTASGEYFTLAPGADLPGDQRGDDGLSLVFETEVLAEPLEILGRPSLKVKLAIDAPLGNLAVRLVDVHPDGMAQRVSLGVLNLAHRGGNATPEPMTPGAFEEVEILLDESGHRFRAGHRIRLAISTAYWPLILPPPSHVTAQLVTGSDSRFTLPVLQAAKPAEMPEPADPDPLPKYPNLEPGETRRWMERDLSAGVTHYLILDDTGANQHPGHGMVSQEIRRECWSIQPEDPLSVTGEAHMTARRSRGDWSTRTETTTRLTADATHFHLTAKLEAYEGEALVFEREWTRKIRRDFM
ncbi:CocE/NonD family hydrolase [Denitrobaculum tricleocarpae]|uniref:CocE/NonD family hydrolase n=1 Tax=Denitrobaculum tricleocarpae TaxID=2591009 RepID=A0A545TEZ0_9PROT|nr:CocE/NonD family hydrolase [Denitrobaculum tricleocarpae]TQV75789.1 CocE/NonD family hydrolase [Denitrobaculum tricleocarpae]